MTPKPNSTVRALWRGPFVLCPMAMYIHDAGNKNSMVACHWKHRGNDEPILARGWGRIQYLPNGAKKMDEWEAFFANLLKTNNITTLEEACAALNAAWGKEQTR